MTSSDRDRAYPLVDGGVGIVCRDSVYDSILLFRLDFLFNVPVRDSLFHEHLSTDEIAQSFIKAQCMHLGMGPKMVDARIPGMFFKCAHDPFPDAGPPCFSNDSDSPNAAVTSEPSCGNGQPIVRSDGMNTFVVVLVELFLTGDTLFFYKNIVSDLANQLFRFGIRANSDVHQIFAFQIG